MGVERAGGSQARPVSRETEWVFSPQTGLWNPQVHQESKSSFILLPGQRLANPQDQGQPPETTTFKQEVSCTCLDINFWEDGGRQGPSHETHTLLPLSWVRLCSLPTTGMFSGCLPSVHECPGKVETLLQQLLPGFAIYYAL